MSTKPVINASASVKTVAVIGAGSWGTSIAMVIAENRRDVTVRMWAYEKSVVASINSRNENGEFLPGISLPPNITATGNLRECLQGADVLIIATPSKIVHDISLKIARYASRESHVGYLSKGFCRVQNEVLTISQTLAKTMPQFRDRVIAISGPSHAEEVSTHFHTCLNVAGADAESRTVFSELLSSEYLQCREQEDIVGVDLGATLKNPAAIAAGMISVLPRCGDNLAGALISEALNEMITLGRLFRVRDEIMMDISGLGDLVATALSDHSRNRRFGRDIARQFMQKGTTVRLYDRILLKLRPQSVIERMSRKLHYLAEGAYAIEPLIELADRHGVSIPVYRSLYEVLLNKKDPKLLIETIKDPEKFEELYRKTKIHITEGKSGLEHISGNVFRQSIIQRAADAFWQSDKHRDDGKRRELIGSLAAYAGGYGERDSEAFAEERRMIRNFTVDNYNDTVHSLVTRYAAEIIDTHKSLVRWLYLVFIKYFLLRRISEFDYSSHVTGHFREIRKIKRSENVIYIATFRSLRDYLYLTAAIDHFGMPFPRFFVNSEAVKGGWRRWLVRCSGGYIVDAGKMSNPLYREVLNRYVSIMIEHGVPVLFFPWLKPGRADDRALTDDFFRVVIDTLYSYTSEIVLVPVQVTAESAASEGEGTRRPHVHFHRPFKLSDFTKPPYESGEVVRSIRLQWEDAVRDA
ncbi:MAG: hypothetical protein JXA20_18995 [Spirochaetes bacterium]|nr:hypothetical protein [Spirochaetota bacterium]